MPQQSMSDFVAELEKIGQLVRITEEKRVDELPAIMEAHPEGALSQDVTAYGLLYGDWRPAQELLEPMYQRLCDARRVELKTPGNAPGVGSLDINAWLEVASPRRFVLPRGPLLLGSLG